MLLLVASCSSSASAPSGQKDPSGQPDISDVIYVGGVTDEALSRLLDASPQNDPRQAVELSAPDLSTPLSKDRSATWQFQLAGELTRAPGPRVWQVRDQPARWQRSIHQFLQLLAPERS